MPAIWFFIYVSCNVTKIYLSLRICRCNNYTDLKWAIGINRTALKIVGLWPDCTLSHQQKRMTNAMALIFFFIMICVSVIPGMLAFVRVWGRLMELLDNVQIGLPFSVTTFKFIVMWFHKDGKYVFLFTNIYSIKFYLILKAIWLVLLHSSLKSLNRSQKWS